MEDIMTTRNKNHHLERQRDAWYFTVMIHGRRIKKSLATASITEARERRDEYLKEIQISGDIQNKLTCDISSKLFGEIVEEWAKITASEVKSSTFQDYRVSMNRFILPRFGNMMITAINYLDIKKFVSELTCSAKRKNNILVPMRSVFKLAFLSGIIEKNPMERVRNLKVTKPDIKPMSMEEVRLFLGNVSVRYRNFFIVAFFTGMRFGEMSGLKWKHVDFQMRLIKVRETRVKGEEGRPKTKKSVRDIKMLPPVMEALRDQRKQTMGKSEYVFLNQYGKPLDPDPTNFYVWKPALKKAGLEARSLYQTRHTFATLMLDAGEHPGWVQKMMGHETLQMIYEKYYSYIKNYERDEGSAFMDKVFNPSMNSCENDIGLGQQC
jgi:integrase